MAATKGFPLSKKTNVGNSLHFLQKVNYTFVPKSLSYLNLQKAFIEQIIVNDDSTELDNFIRAALALTYLRKTRSKRG